MKRMTRIFASLIIIPASLTVAASSYSFKCSNTNCNFKGEVTVGPTMSRHSITGYCTTCRKFVSIVWSNNSGLPANNLFDKSKTLPKKAPDPVGSVWNPADGQTATLYSCPTCKNSFMEMKNSSFKTAYRGSPNILISQLSGIASSENKRIRREEREKMKNPFSEPLSKDPEARLAQILYRRDEEARRLELAELKIDAAYRAVAELTRKVTLLSDELPMFCPRCTNQTFTATSWASFD